jgi:hypothetical protein
MDNASNITFTVFSVCYEIEINNMHRRSQKVSLEGEGGMADPEAIYNLYLI